jgi:integrase
MSQFNPTKHTNLVRRKTNDEYILFAKINGKLWREGLGTTNESIALQRRDDRIAEIRRASNIASIGGEHETVKETLQAYLDKITTESEVESTKAFDIDLIKSVSRALDDARDDTGRVSSKKTRSVTEDDLKSWSKKFRERVGNNRFNMGLGKLRKAFEFARDRGVCQRNPAKKLKRLRVDSKIPVLPSIKQFKAIINAMRRSGHRASQDAADMVEFMAYSGCRKKESYNVLGADIDEDGGRIHVRVVKGITFKSEPRFVPISSDMRNLIARLKLRPGGIKPSEPVLRVKKCQRTLTSACKEVGCVRITHHTLRHLFATRAIESDVPIVTVAKWLGHRDGGVLAMKRYGHLRDEHSAEMMKKVSFSTDDQEVAEAPAKEVWIRPMGVESRYIPTGVKNFQRITATGEIVHYSRVDGNPTRTPLGTWDIQEAQKIVAERV